VVRGQRVKRGEKVALVGSTGISSGPHLHYEVWVNGRPVDPMKYVLPDAIVD
jgi:murein DD-endopeptidase MepM/ murein hydrolase activator NlpD